MFSAIRRHLGYANVAATLALVFSMSGGALAAKHYLINSTKQLNPKVLRALRGNKGATGPKGATGAAGLAGGIGPKGAAGSTGPMGPAGPTYSAFTTGEHLVLEGTETVLSLSINPPFAGHLLVQASGQAIAEKESAFAECVPLLGTVQIGSVVGPAFATKLPSALALTGAATVAAGPQTVSVQCTGRTARIRLTMFALVTG